MILNELQKIKSFGCQLESKVTLEDIERKEAELGCKLPIALKEFYLTFSEEDPIFKSDDRFFTLDQLQVVGGEIKTFINEGNDWCWKFGKTVVFLELKFKTQFIWGIAFQVSDSCLENPPCMYYRSTPNSFVPTSDFPPTESIADYLLYCVGNNQMYCQPYVIMSNGGCHYCENKNKFEKIQILGKNPDISYGYTKKFDLFTKFLYECPLLISVPNPELVETYAKYLEIDGYSWHRKDGKPANPPKERKPVKPRPLNSILPIIERFKSFFNITEGGYPESLLAEAEERLGISFVLPLRELYLSMPKERLEEYSAFVPPEELEFHEDDEEKIEFLCGHQGIPEYALEAGSPIVYQLDDCEDKWEAYEVMDGFLAAELLWSLMNQQYLNDKHIAVGSWEECPKRALTPKGKLGKYLVSDTQKLTKGNIRHLYHSPEGDILALYDSEAKELYLVAKSDEIMLKLEEATGIDLVLW